MFHTERHSEECTHCFFTLFTNPSIHKWMEMRDKITALGPRPLDQILLPSPGSCSRFHSSHAVEPAADNGKQAVREGGPPGAKQCSKSSRVDNRKSNRQSFTPLENLLLGQKFQCWLNSAPCPLPRKDLPASKMALFTGSSLVLSIGSVPTETGVL